MSNALGGANNHSLYVPMSDIEQEVIARLSEAGELLVVLHGFLTIQNPPVTYGDKNLHVHLKADFKVLEKPAEVSFFDMELKTQTGICLFRQTMPTTYDNKPIMVGPEVVLEMIWDIAINNINPELVKQIKPGAIGLTSRLQDKDTGDFTLYGNMKLNTHQKNLVHKVASGEKKGRLDTLNRLKKKV
jgi:hypothetical protein